MVRHLWIGAAVIVVGGITGKQLLFQHVSAHVMETRMKEHEEGSKALIKAYEDAKKYQLPPLTDAEKAKMKELMAKELQEIESDE